MDQCCSVRPPSSAAVDGKKLMVDREAEFEALLLAQVASLRRYATRLTRSPTDADDLLQDTLLRCWRARSRFVAGTNIGAWARTVLRNAFLSGVRGRAIEVSIADDHLARLRPVNAAQEAAIELGDAYRALGQVAEPHRSALALAIDGVSVDDAARRLDVPANTYKSWVHRGRARLRMLIDGPTLAQATA